MRCVVSSMGVRKLVRIFSRLTGCTLFLRILDWHFLMSEVHFDDKNRTSCRYSLGIHAHGAAIILGQKSLARRASGCETYPLFHDKSLKGHNVFLLIWVNTDYC